MDIFEGLTRDVVTTYMAYAMLLVPVLVVLRVLAYGVEAGLAVCYAVRGRRARHAELAAWKAYYAKLAELEALKKRVERERARLQADAKVKVPGGAKPGATVPLLDARQYLAAVQAQDQLVDDFEQTGVKPLQEAANDRTAERQWYADRTIRDLVMWGIR